MPRPRKFDEMTALRAARDQFWASGYDATSVQELAGATGLGSQSLYNTFGGKHELFLRALDDYCATRVAGLERALGSGAEPWQAALNAAVYEDGGRLALTGNGCFLAASTSALAARDPQVQERTARTYDAIRSLFTEALARAREAGSMRGDADPGEAALAFLTMMQGIEFLRKAGLAPQEFEAAKKAAARTLIVAYAC
jgi:AcrR family transcriptional regulator